MSPFALAVLLCLPAAPAPDAQGDALPPGAVARIGTTRLRHGSSLAYSLAFSLDGKRLTSTDGYSVALWDSRTGRSLASRSIDTDYEFWSPVVSSDGTLIACRMRNRSLGVLETESGKLRCELSYKESEFQDLAFSKDNRWLVACDQNGMVKLWDLPAGKLAQKWETPGNEKSCFRHAFTSNGKTLVHSAHSEHLLFWDVQTGKELLNIEAKGEDHGSICGLAASPDGKLLATVSRGGRITLWEVKTGRLVREVAALANPFGALLFSPDSKQVLTSRESGEICVWDVETGKLARELKGAPEENSKSLAISPDGNYLASGGCDHVIHMWNLTTGKEMFRSENDLGGEVSGRFLSDGKTLLSHCRYDTHGFPEKLNARLGFWDLNGNPIRKAVFDPNDAHKLAISPDASTIALAVGPNRGRDPNKELRSSIRLCDLATGKELVKLQDLRCEIRALDFSPDGRFLFIYAENAGPTGKDFDRLEVVQVWKRSSPTSLDKIGEFPAAASFEAPFFCAPDSKWIGVPANLGWDFYQCQTGRLLRRYPGFPGNVRATSASGRVLASIDGERSKEILHEQTPVLVELATGKRICKLECESKYLVRPLFAISTDGGTVASDLNSKTIVLWDAFTSKQIGKLEGHRGGICSLCFSPDGRYLVSGSADTTILIWDYRKQLPKLAAETTDLAPKRLEELWQDLQASDPERGYRAVAVLVQAPSQAILLLKEKIRPATAATR